MLFASYDPRKKAKQTSLLMHRFILGLNDPEIEIDHEDRNGLNNQRYNLRKAEDKNQQNVGLRKDNKSGFKGVTWSAAAGMWRARIRIETKEIHLGVFTDLIEAAKVYDAAAIKYHGKFAYTNF